MTLSRREAALGLAGALGINALPLRALAQPGPPITDEPDTEVGADQARTSHLVAPVMINGQGPFDFLMDTGANVSCVSHALAERLALTPAAASPVHTVVGVKLRPSVILDHLEIGARSRRSVRAPALPLTDAAVDGVLGVDWLKGQRLVLDFRQHRLEITKSRHDTSGGNVVVVPARRRLGQLTIVDADLSGEKISAMVDSGSQISICNTPLRQLLAGLDARKRLPPRDARPVRMESLAGETFYGEMLYLPFMRLGGLNLGNVPVVHADLHVFDVWGLKTTPAVVLGMDLLKEFKSVALDFGRSQVRFDLA